MSKKTDTNLVTAALKCGDYFLNTFKQKLSPTSIEAIGDHLTYHTLRLIKAQASGVDLIPVIMGLCLRLTCDTEVKAFLKAEEAANAAQDK